MGFTSVMPRALAGLVLLLGLPPAPAGLAAEEPPIFKVPVSTRELPPMAERLPAEPRRDLPRREDWQEGRYGGTLNILTRGGRDPRDLVLLGYARLVVWDEDYRLIPDILSSVEIVEGRRFTSKRFREHPGHDPLAPRRT